MGNRHEHGPCLKTVVTTTEIALMPSLYTLSAVVMLYLQQSIVHETTDCGDQPVHVGAVERAHG